MLEDYESKFVWELLIRLGLVEESIDRSGKLQYFLTEAGCHDLELIQNLSGPVVIVQIS
jgi:hypothetical protein